jgi:glutamyl-tRNA synthetase
MKKQSARIRAYAVKNAVEHEGKARVEAVLSALFHEGLKREEVGKIIEQVKKEVEKINKLSKEEQKQEFSIATKLISKRKEREGLPPLPKAKKGKVIMRFAPSASGPLHIGHAATACISFLYVQEYGGKFYVRIEDTNPENVYADSYKMIKEDSRWLFNNKAEIVIQSKRMELYYEYAGKLIGLGKAYVCDCSQKKIQENRRKGVECSCRQFSIDEQEKRWQKMLARKGYKEGGAILRFKGNMQAKNPALRDFPLARINLTKHPLQGKKYRVWPLMNFAVAIDDIEQKMTHIIRAKEHRDNAERQKMIYKALGKKYPWTAFLGRWHFSDLELSTTKMRKAIEAGKFKNWQDPRLPTLASLRKQGYKPQAFWKLAEQVGLSETDKVISKKEYFELLEQFNKRISFN